MKLYGTTTSPFVRRVRIVATEIGAHVELINTATDDGQALLRKVTPIWKVPVAEVDGRVLFDSRVIIDWLTTTRGWGRLAPPHDRWAQANLLSAIDGALDSAIQVFYLRRESLATAELPFAKKQHDRITAIFDWLGGELAAGRFGHEAGLAEISLVCTLDWMEFRETYPVASLAGRFDGVRAHLAARDSFVATRPHT
jgi:glutathione S-transferase